ncbi:enoyl-CoA hydratase-related protein [Rhodococcus sp. NPDC057014]|uniref:enoyl-CoA hydratase-related protein n=1 Tax=unclassified Rhodococcus (in: high G+C Gram-positive bacteria) TaxID=192944 RepID=UPI0023E1718A|nr:enoyl-CoA hydratase-related protein [Rhodococcus sp. T2V]MDF3313277.1 enoyl-CoA hydratase-related protein [Rhodococcus sp. T2V]
MSAEATPADEHLLVERRGSILLVTLNRPEVKNAITRAMADRLHVVTREFQSDKDLHVLVLTGAGDSAFCAGADLGGDAVGDSPTSLRDAFPDPGKRFFSDVTKPVIAAVNGVCVAGGMELMLGSDIRVVAERAKFGVPEARWALMPVGGGVVRLARQLPWAKAMELLLVANTMTASEALDLGLVNRVVPTEDVLSTALELADRIQRNGPLAVRRIKEAVLQASGVPLYEALYTELLLGSEVFRSNDAQEGPQAFMEKRQPVYRGD